MIGIRFIYFTIDIKENTFSSKSLRMQNEAPVQMTWDLKNGKISGYRMGTGRIPVFCFPGFGDRAEMFLGLQNYLPSDYSAYCLDLPFHGKTKWYTEEYTPIDFLEWINLIMNDHKQEEVVFVAFSFGGRLLQTIAPLYEGKVKAVCLIAPDGIKTHRWFDVSNVPVGFRRLVKLILKAPRFMQFSIHSAYKLRIISRFLSDFAWNHIKTAERRNRIANTWISLRHFPDQKAIFYKMLSKKKNNKLIPLLIYLGKRDEVIKPEIGEIFKREVFHAEIYLQDEGHRLIDERFFSVFAQWLTDIENTKSPEKF
jgi:pimeloyl-ACP methyl ester carboxylesterase